MAFACSTMHSHVCVLHCSSSQDQRCRHEVLQANKHRHEMQCMQLLLLGREGVSAQVMGIHAKVVMNCTTSLYYTMRACELPEAPCASGKWHKASSMECTSFSKAATTITAMSGYS